MVVLKKGRADEYYLTTSFIMMFLTLKFPEPLAIIKLQNYESLGFQATSN